MAVRPLVLYPDPRLALKADPVTAFDGALKDLAQDVLDTMRAAPGVGLTACHIGVMQRLVVLELEPGAVRIFVNPLVLEAGRETHRFTEGSVSLPGLHEEIERPARIRFSYHTLEGEAREEEAVGFLSSCLQHEIDQLDGIFWLQRLSRLKRDRLLKRFDKSRR